MAEKKVITPDDLNPQHFIVKSDKKVHLANLTNEYVCQFHSGATITSGSNPDDRKKLSVRNGLGVIHLDFSVENSSESFQNLADIPRTAPLCNKLIEVQTYDGGFVFLGSRRRTIVGKGLTAGRRYVVDLIGYFE